MSVTKDLDPTSQETAEPNAFSDGSRYLRAFALSLLIAVFPLGALELYVRASGGLPSADNGTHSWARIRHNAQLDTNPNSIVLLGASRMQGNVALETLSKEAGGENVYQLAVAGKLPFASFEDIALKSEFRGLVVLSTLPFFLVPGPARLQQTELTRYYHWHWNLARHFDSWLNNQVKLSLAMKDPHYRLVNMLRNVIKSGSLFGRPLFLITENNREQSQYFDVVNDVEAKRSQELLRMTDWLGLAKRPYPKEWTKMLQTEISELVSLIEDRGGRVVFVYMPVADDLLEIDENEYPRAEYWDQIARLTGADTIHFKDHPEMSDFDLPDASHLDQRDKEAFTRGLAKTLRSLNHLN